MTFREAVLSKMPAKKRAKAAACKGRLAQMMWKAAENLARHEIEHRTGQRLVGVIDWAKWIALLIQIMPLLLKLLALFGI